MKDSSRIVLRSFVAAAILSGAAACLGAQSPGDSAPPASGADRGLVLVELFTSEGCPHCPEADALLERLYAAQPMNGVEIVPLEEHVDYWDRPEWVDHFSSPRFTERQKSYAEAMDVESLYTPQMVVDGLVEFVGNNESRARASISALGHSLTAPLRFSPASGAAGAAPPRQAGAQVRLEGKDLALGGPASVFLVLAEDKLSSRVGGGKNAGESWKHSSVARWFYRVGQLRAEEKSFSAGLALAPLDPQWRPENLRLIAIVQEEESRKVTALGVARWTELISAAPASTAVPQSGMPVPPAAPATSKSSGPPGP